MKKTLTAAALSSLMVLGLATSALAIHETDTAEEPIVAKGPSKVTIDGSVRERGIFDQNNWNDDASAQNYYDSRVQLGVGAKVSDQANAYVRLESGYDTNDNEIWGQTNSDANSAAANSAFPTANGSLHRGGNKLGTLNVLESWVNYSPGPWGVKAGHMPLALGNKVFFDHTGSGDDALVFYGNIGEATHLAALTIKFDEQFTNDNSDDLDGYVLLGTSKINDALNLGANWTYLRGGSDTGAAFGAGNFFDLTPPVNLNGQTGDLIALPAGYELAAGMSMSNIGLTADGKIGPIDYMADLELQFGDVANYSNGAGDGVTVDAGGWAAKVGANYDLGVGKVGLLFGYGSGDEDKAHKDQLTDGDTDLDHDAFINFLTDTNYDTIIAGYRAAIPGANSWASAAGTGDAATGRYTGLSNLTLIQLNGSTKTVCPLTGKDLSLFTSLSYMKLSEDMINGTDEDGNDNEVDNVGTELDLVATWQLTPGLDYKVEAAYLWTGDVYEVETAGHSSDTQDLAFVRHSLDLKF